MKEIFSEEIKKTAKNEATIIYDLHIKSIFATLGHIALKGIAIIACLIIVLALIYSADFNKSIGFISHVGSSISAPFSFENCISLLSFVTSFTSLLITSYVYTTIKKVKEKDWKEIYMKEQRLRYKHRDAFNAFNELKKNAVTNFPEVSIFFDYYKDVFGKPLDSLTEFNISHSEYILSEEYELCRYSLSNKKIANELSDMIEEDWLVMEKWYMFLCQSELRKATSDNKESYHD